MFVTAIGHYLPSTIIPNSYFSDVNGLSDEWIFSRTGIKTRRKAAPGENTNTMAFEAVKDSIERYAYDIKSVDLIVGASYSPYDTVGTLGDYIQHQYDIANAKVVYISSACSSFINALEIVEGYFATNKSKRALVVTSEHNNAYNDETDEKSGHLWGDGAAAVLVSKDRQSQDDYEIKDIVTYGRANEGKGPNGVYLRPLNGGLIMPYGKDVFVHACKHMACITTEILERNNYTIKDLDYLIPHQANIRIINKVAKDLGITAEQTIVNVDRYGNTGCASTPIGLFENMDRMKPSKNIVISVFGGGYSSGAVLMRSPA